MNMFTREDFPNFFADEERESVPIQSLLAKSREFEDLIELSTPNEFPHTFDEKILATQVAEDFNTPLVEKTKQIIAESGSTREFQNIVSTAVFMDGLENHIYGEEDAFFSEIKLNPIEQILFGQQSNEMLAQGESIVVSHKETMMEVRGKKILLPRVKKNVFSGTSTLASILASKFRASFRVLSFPPNKYWVELLEKFLPMVRYDDEDAFYIINDDRGLSTRKEAVNSYIWHAYSRVLRDFPDIRIIALHQPARTEEVNIGKIVRWYEQYSQSRVQVVEYTEHTPKSPEVLILKPGWTRTLSTPYYYTDSSTPFDESVQDRLVSVFGESIVDHIGVSQICLSYNGVPFNVKYKLKDQNLIPVYPKTRLSIGVYAFLPHRTRNHCVISPASKFRGACLRLSPTRKTSQPFSLLYERICFSLRRNMRGLGESSALYEIHKDFLRKFSDKYSSQVSDKYAKNFNMAYVEEVFVFLMDDKNRFTNKKHSWLDENTLLEFLKGVPDSKDQAKEAYMLKSPDSRFSAQELAETALFRGLICEILVGSKVKYYLPLVKETRQNILVPKTRNDVLLTDGYGIMGNLNATKVLSVDSVSTALFRAIGVETNDQKTPPVVSMRGTPEGSRRSKKNVVRKHRLKEVPKSRTKKKYRIKQNW